MDLRDKLYSIAQRHVGRELNDELKEQIIRELLEVVDDAPGPTMRVHIDPTTTQVDVDKGMVTYELQVSFPFMFMINEALQRAWDEKD